jgi:hypothetical protein
VGKEWRRWGRRHLVLIAMGNGVGLERGGPAPGAKGAERWVAGDGSGAMGCWRGSETWETANGPGPVRTKYHFLFIQSFSIHAN